MDKHQTLQTIMDVISESYRENVQLDPATPLQELRGFDSLFLTDLIDRLEERLQRVLEPQFFVPETFENPMTIYQAFRIRESDNEDESVRL